MLPLGKVSDEHTGRFSENSKLSQNKSLFFKKTKCVSIVSCVCVCIAKEKRQLYSLEFK